MSSFLLIVNEFRNFNRQFLINSNYNLGSKPILIIFVNARILNSELKGD